MKINQKFSRRHFLGRVGIVALGATGCMNSESGDGSQVSKNQNPTLPETPSCLAPNALTPSATEGPFYTSNTPLRDNFLAAGTQGTPLIIEGQVLTPDCQPIQGATLDFWQADDAGNYDNVGYQLRGHQLTNEKGFYQLTTIIPARYPGRPRHIHVKVQGENTKLLTTQLFFRGDPVNPTDSIFREELLLFPKPNQNGVRTVGFNFVIS